LLVLSTELTISCRRFRLSNVSSLYLSRVPASVECHARIEGGRIAKDLLGEISRS
jgi:hypothetical protein